MRGIVLCAGLVSVGAAVTLDGAFAQSYSTTAACGYYNQSTGKPWATDQYQYPCVNSSAVPTPTAPETVTPTALALSSVTTGGTAQTLVAAGGAPRGGFVLSPASGTLCIDLVTTAGTLTGTPATTACSETWNGKYGIPPSTNAISINSPASGTKISGNLY